MLTGPEREEKALYLDPLIRPAWQVVGGVDCSLSGPETFAVLAAAKATALKSARGQSSIAAVGAVLNVDLTEELVLAWLRAISPSSARMSPHRLEMRDAIFGNDSYHEFSITTLGRSRDEIMAVNWDDSGAPLLSYDAPGTYPERFAAHLIYRTRIPAPGRPLRLSLQRRRATE
ncbi:hypothetical protein ETD86_10820 [Nonomuraea turkmeniaca]|uniref:Uncharacterized protein n=1 Tax=Nonomuraea turkmeniaca TaxID=103838 RepID=A0A5S4FR07_9ACTN|nr:hypothetical protein ETD86_10820 [Nonomuraea turkmeniaca]